MLRSPTVQNSAPSPETPFDREIVGWAGLLILFSLLVFTSLLGAADRLNVNSLNPSNQQSFLSSAYRSGAASVMTPIRKAKLTQIAHALALPAMKDPSAAAVVLVVDNALGVAPASPLVPLLQRSGVPRYEWLAAIQAPHAAIGKRPNNEFMYRLAEALAAQRNGNPKLLKTLQVDYVQPSSGAGVAGGLVIVLIFGALGVGLNYLFDPQNRNLSIYQHPIEPVSPLRADHLASRAFLLMSGYVLVSLVLGSVLGSVPVGFRESEIGQSLIVFAPEAAIVVVTFFLLKMPLYDEKLSFSNFRISLSNFPRDLLWGAGGFVVAITAALTMMVVGVRIGERLGLPPAKHPLDVMISESPHLLPLLITVLAACVLAPIFEETLFRGILLPAFAGLFRRRGVGLVAGALISSFLFASIHPQGIPAWLGLGAFACVNCLLAYRTRSLMPCIICHGLFNLFAIVVGSFAGRI